jgi:hypothetical protein
MRYLRSFCEKERRKMTTENPENPEEREEMRGSRPEIGCHICRGMRLMETLLHPLL